MKILLIDDEADVREVTQLSLGVVGGMQVDEASGGREGIEKALAAPPDAIILDRTMPGMDGIATFHALRERAELREVPIIFLTASAMPRDVDELLAMGAAGVITKPFQPMTLAAEVRRILERR